MEQPGDKESNEKNGKTAIDATHDGACGGKGALDNLRGPRIFMCVSVEAAAGKARMNRTMVPGSPFFRRLGSETSRETVLLLFERRETSEHGGSGGSDTQLISSTMSFSVLEARMHRTRSFFPRSLSVGITTSIT